MIDFSQLTFYEIFVQFVGLVAFIVNLVGFVSKSDFRLKLICGFGCLLFASHFYLLGVYAATATVTIASIRNFMSIRYKQKYLAYVFFALYLCTIPLNNAGWVGYFPIISGMFTTYAFYFTEGIKMRQFLVVGSISWFVHNLLVGSYAGVAAEIVNFSFLCTGIRRLQKAAKYGLN